MNFKLDNVKDKRPFFDKVNLDVGWESELVFLDSHPEQHVGRKEDKMRIYLSSCTKRGSLYPWAQTIIQDMEDVFVQNQISLIKFYSFGESGQSYPWHADKMDVFLVQALGECDIRVENTNCETKSKVFRPGDCVFIPRGTHHELTPNSSRLTYSFGVEGQPDPSTYVAI
tara:strand:+ start:14448 stop:14957 length:510 start_codon:yes stop_codon:yes gene_type:complete